MIRGSGIDQIQVSIDHLRPLPAQVVGAGVRLQLASWAVLSMQR